MTKDITPEYVLGDLRYLQLLARSFPTVADASTEIINLEAILNLPKGTEHFLSDIHGEHQAFNHVLKNASGAIKRKVNEIFSNTLRDYEKKELCTLIYYPEQKLELVSSKEPDLDDWYLITLNQLVRVCRNVPARKCARHYRKSSPISSRSCCMSRRSSRISRPMWTRSSKRSSRPGGQTISLSPCVT